MATGSPKGQRGVREKASIIRWYMSVKDVGSTAQKGDARRKFQARVRKWNDEYADVCGRWSGNLRG